MNFWLQATLFRKLQRFWDGTLTSSLPQPFHSVHLPPLQHGQYLSPQLHQYCDVVGWAVSCKSVCKHWNKKNNSPEIGIAGHTFSYFLGGPKKSTLYLPLGGLSMMLLQFNCFPVRCYVLGLLLHTPGHCTCQVLLSTFDR